MAIENKITTFLNNRKSIIPILFGLMCLCLVATLVGVELKGLKNMDHFLTFNTGAEIAAIFAGVMITVSILPAYKRHSGYTRVFVSLIALLCFLMACDTGEALVDKVVELSWLNILFPTLVWASETAVWFFFFVYSTHVLKSKGKTISILYLLGFITLLVFVLIPFVTIKDPLYFKVVDGVYYRKGAEDHYTWYISRLPSAIFSVFTIIAMCLSKEKALPKVIISLFMGLPLLAMGSGGYKTGVAIQYVTMMMSVILIFAFVFGQNEKELFSTNKELGIATNIQKHMLPSIFPAFPERKEFDVYASMTPAKEVGGDFYDFFLIDENHLGLVMADVSDKGVPAALFMMASKIMVQNYAMTGKSPSEVLTSVNNQICQNNQDEMFVTIWFGILDLKTGILTAANAGHEKPVIKNPDGSFEIFKDKHGFVVGWYKNVKYTDYQIQLKKGSKIFLYTDGVPEATSSNGQFTRERMVETLNKYHEMNPEDIVKNMKKDIDKFVGQADQFDDITMLCCQYYGFDESSNGSMKNYKMDADVDNIDKMIEPIMTSLEAADANPKAIYQINLALEEILVNVARYAYSPNKGIIDISYEISDNPKKLRVIIKDKGKAFNPLEKEEPDLDASVQDRKIGGLGIYIVKNIVDDIKYERINDENILEFIKNI